MKKEYDFSKARRNPYAARLKRPVTIRLDTLMKNLADACVRGEGYRDIRRLASSASTFDGSPNPRP